MNARRQWPHFQTRKGGARLTRGVPARAQQMCLLLREAMNVGKIALSQFFFSTELESREARQRIKDELSGFCVVTEAPKTTFGKVFSTAPIRASSALPNQTPWPTRFARPTPASSTASRTTFASRCSWRSSAPKSFTKIPSTVASAATTTRPPRGSPTTRGRAASRRRTQSSASLPRGHTRSVCRGPPTLAQL